MPRSSHDTRPAPCLPPGARSLPRLHRHGAQWGHPGLLQALPVHGPMQGGMPLLRQDGEQAGLQVLQVLLERPHLLL
jgi:hypothetical protein